jgi:hypothetical protein
MSWDSFVQQRVYLDCVAFAVLSLIHVVANWQLTAQYPNEPGDRAAAATSLGGSVNGGLAAVGILLPLSLVVTQIPGIATSALQHVVYADIWFGLSLLFGVYTTYTIGVRAVGENIVNRRDVRLTYGFQLMSLVIGTVRLVATVWLLATP